MLLIVFKSERRIPISAFITAMPSTTFTMDEVNDYLFTRAISIPSEFIISVYCTLLKFVFDICSRLCFCKVES